MNLARELQDRLNHNTPSAERGALLATIAADGATVRKSEAEPPALMIQMVVGQIGSSKITGNRLTGADALLSALNALSASALIDRFVVRGPNELSHACFVSGSNLFLGALTTHRGKGRALFTSSED